MADDKLETPTIPKVLSVTKELNNVQIAQELPAQTQFIGDKENEFTRELPARIEEIDKTISTVLLITMEEIERIFLCSPISKINWASHMVLLDSTLPLGARYWYMK